MKVAVGNKNSDSISRDLLGLYGRFVKYIFMFLAHCITLFPL
jgi:hypothetical protein